MHLLTMFIFLQDLNKDSSHLCYHLSLLTIKILKHKSSPYALIKCRLPIPHIRLDQVLKHLIQREYSDATGGKQTPAILDLNHSTCETINKYNL